MRILALSGAALVTASLWIMPAASSTMVVGSGNARECYLGAELRRSVRVARPLCDRALADETLSQRDRAATHVNRGIVLMHARDLDGAITDFGEALRIEPLMAEAHVNRGIALLHRGGADGEAVAALTRGLELKPSRPEVAHYSRAIAHEILGNAREAYEDYAAAAALDPKWTDPAEQLKRFSVERRRVARG